MTAFFLSRHNAVIFDWFPAFYPPYSLFLPWWLPVVRIIVTTCFHGGNCQFLPWELTVSPLETVSSHDCNQKGTRC